MKHFLAIALFLFGSSATLLSQSSGNQLLWQISHPDLAFSSYLYGTMHVQDERAFQFSDSVLAKLYDSEVFAMEVDPVSSIQALFEERSLMSSPQLEEILSEEDFEALNQRFEQEMGFTLYGIRANQLHLLDQMMGDAAPDSNDRETFVDGYFYGLARQWGKQTVGLESVDNQLESIRDHNISYTAEELQEILLWRLTHQDDPSYIDMLTNIYEKGDLETIDEWVNDSYSSRDSKAEQLFLRRNYEMKDSIVQLVNRTSAFVAVGAAHLPGEEGLIRLLQKAGFDLHVVTATYTGLAQVYEAKPKQAAPWIEYSPPEGAYSVSLPYKPFVFPGLKEKIPTDMYMCMDLGSGHFFMTMYIPIPTAVDSAKMSSLFEAMKQQYVNEETQKAGARIISETSISTENRQGTDVQLVSNERGLTMRYQVLIHNQLAYFFLVGGQGIDLDSDHANRFFESIELLPLKPNPLSLYEDPFLAFKVQLPASAKKVKQMTPVPQIGPEDSLATYSIQGTSGKEVMFCNILQYPTDFVFYDEQEALNLIIEETKIKMGIDTFMFDSLFTQQGFLARELAGSWTRVEGYDVRLRYVPRIGKIYILGSFYPTDTDPKKIQEVFDSFELLAPRPGTWSEFRDSRSQFAVLFPNPPISTDELEEEEFDFDDLYGNFELLSERSYVAMDTNSGISYSLLHTVHSDYAEYTDMDSLFEDYLDLYRDDENFDLIPVDSSRLEKEEHEGDAYEYWAKLGKSHLYLRTRSTVKGKHLFIQVALLPKAEIRSYTTERFFNSLDLSEIPEEGDLFSEKLTPILQDISNNDSTKRIMARRALYNHAPLEKEIPIYLDAFGKTYGDEKEGSTPVLEIIGDHLAYLDASEMIPLVKKHYTDFADVPTLQVELLEDLAQLSSPEALDLLTSYLTSPPREAPYSASRRIMSFLLESDNPAAVVPTILPLLSDSIWWDKAIFFFSMAVDSGLMHLDTMPQVSTEILNKMQQSLEQIALATSKEDKESKTYTAYRWLNISDKLPDSKRRQELWRSYEQIEDAYVKNRVIELELAAGMSPGSQAIENLFQLADYRVAIYTLLMEAERPNLIPKKFRKQAVMAEGYMARTIEWFDEALPKEIKQLERKTIQFQGEKRWVYLYQLRWDAYEAVGFSGLFMPDKSSLSLSQTDYLVNFYYLEDEERSYTIEERWEEYQQVLKERESSSD